VREEDTIIKFITAYSILQSETYIPGKYKGYVKLMKVMGGNEPNHAPTKLKLLQFKIDLDRHLNKITEKIYNKVRLK